MGRLYEGSNNKTLFPKRERQAEITNRHKLKRHRISDRTRENQGLPSSIHDIGIGKMCLQKGRSNDRPFDLSVHITPNAKRTSQG